MESITEVSTFTMAVREGDIITVTDPCYDEGTWCIVKTGMPSGVYGFAAVISDTGDWGERVCRSIMFNLAKLSPTDVDSYHIRKEYLGEAGVDAGLCGYFIDKPDFSNETWHEFCEALRNRRPFHGALPEFANGYFTSSGYGDGGYNVYLLRDCKTNEPVGLCIDFINIDEDEDEDWEDEEDDEDE